MDKLIINVDFDGVLIPNHFEKMLIEKLSEIPLTSGISHSQSKVFDWYIDMVNTSPLAPLNTNLLDVLIELDNVVLRLWTNRNHGISKRTIENLGGYTRYFDSFQFYEGEKSSSQVEGIVIDNSTKYLKCGEMGLHYEWKGGNNG